MTHQQHQARHNLLHEHFDELVADWISHTEKRPSESTVWELIEWSHKQTQEPDGKHPKTTGGRNVPKFVVSENTIMWALRYGLPRKSGVYIDITDTLKRVWKDLERATQVQMRHEIMEAIRTGNAGDIIDSVGWAEFVEWIDDQEKTDEKKH